ncbi:uncharacterized protein LOC128236226 [Mya arenaria]|uniref:uncharacterized protein LOC128236226 n=1 Tax=Mya arenaria TaxID=6604 RepID=UPI0022E216D0|nr:uncharacterized protein LOC128236226 [Mya arenaria]
MARNGKYAEGRERRPPREFSVVVIVAFAIMGLATLFQIIALISDSWVNTVTDADGTVGSAGLWRTCADYAGIDSCRGFVWSDNQVSHWFRTVQTLEVIGFLFGAVALFLFALYHMVEMCMDNRVLKLSAIGLLMLAFLLVFCGTIVVASLKDVQKAIELPKTEAVVSWGFGLSLTASILYLAGGVVVAISPQP